MLAVTPETVELTTSLESDFLNKQGPAYPCHVGMLALQLGKATWNFLNEGCRTFLFKERPNDFGLAKALFQNDSHCGRS